MRNPIAKIVTALSCLVVFCSGYSLAFAQEPVHRAKVGISAAVQSEQLDILIPVWLSERFVIIPSIGFVGVSDSYTDFALGFALRFNAYHHDGKAVPYGGGRVAALQFSPEGPADGATDFVFGPFLGGEYLLDDHFSFGVEAQLNITKSDDNSLRFSNPGGTNINTATAVMATFYF